MKAFENAKVGDNVFCLIYGRGIIENISIDDTKLPILVKFRNQEGRGVVKCIYTIEGKNAVRGAYPMLYWGEPKIIAPERPKTLVEKTLIRYTNVYEHQLGSLFVDKNKCIENAGSGAIYSGAEVIIKYQIEE